MRKTRFLAATDERRTLLAAVRLFSGEWLSVTAVLVSTVFTTAVWVLPAFLIRDIINDAIGHHNLRLLLRLCLALLIIPAFSGLAGVGQAYWMAQISQRVMAKIRQSLYDSLARQDVSFFLHTPAGEIQSRLTNDVIAVEDVVVTSLRGAIVNLTVVASVVLSMFLMSWPLALLSLSAAPVFLGIAYKVGRAQKNNSRVVQEKLASLSEISHEALSIGGIVSTFVFGRFNYMRERYRVRSAEVSRAGIKNQMTGRWFFQASSMLFAWVPAITYMVAGWAIIDHIDLSVSIGTIVAFATLQGRLFAPSGSLSQLLTIQVQVQGSIGIFQRIFDYINLPVGATAPASAGETSIATGPRSQCQDVAGNYNGLVLSSVSFGFSDLSEGAAGRTADTGLFDGLDLHIPLGQTVAMVGPSGAGKSTLGYLACGLLQPRSGKVLISGVDMSLADVERRATLVGLASQDAHMLNASVRDNLLFARPDAPFDALQKAMNLVGLHDKIMQLPNGYDTVIGERGQMLSSGERQRLSIGRIILQDPSLVILDEATNALDATSQKELLDTLKNQFRSKATMIIAHQVWTITSADKIMLLDHGRIVETGTHSELIALNMTYARFARLQLGEEDLRKQQNRSFL